MEARVGVACWLAERGARYLALVGRHGADPANARALVQKLASRGVQVLAGTGMFRTGTCPGAVAECAGSCRRWRGDRSAGVLDDGVLLIRVGRGSGRCWG